MTDKPYYRIFWCKICNTSVNETDKSCHVHNYMTDKTIIEEFEDKYREYFGTNSWKEIKSWLLEQLTLAESRGYNKCKQEILDRNKIILTFNNGKIIVSPEDYDFINQWKWRIDHGGYANCQWQVEGRGRTVFMHQAIMIRMGVYKFGMHKQGLQIDHINGDRLDCRRENLRLCKSVENHSNRTHRKYEFKGISPNDNKKRWQAHIHVKGRNIYLGTYDTKEQAARSYDSAAIKYFGEYANLNFPVKKIC